MRGIAQVDRRLAHPRHRQVELAQCPVDVRELDQRVSRVALGADVPIERERRLQVRACAELIVLHRFHDRGKIVAVAERLRHSRVFELRERQDENRRRFVDPAHHRELVRETRGRPAVAGLVVQASVQLDGAFERLDCLAGRSHAP